MIGRFAGSYAFLSNFYPAPIEVQGIAFPTVEHAYQAAKISFDLAPDRRRACQRAIASFSSPGRAKREGRNIKLRTDWIVVRLHIMERLLRLKFAICPLDERLWLTWPYELVEGNEWKDTFWGVCDGRGDNNLGRLLMKIRDE